MQPTADSAGNEQIAAAIHQLHSVQFNSYPTAIHQLHPVQFNSYPTPPGLSSRRLYDEGNVRIIRIPQEEYRDGLKSRGPLNPPIGPFNDLLVRDAAEGKLHGLYNPTGPAFSVQVRAQKMSVRILLEGFGKEGLYYGRQINVRKASRKTLTRAELVKRVAKEVQSFMKLNGRGVLQKMGVEPDKVVLLDILHVSKGSLQLIIGVLRD